MLRIQTCILLAVIPCLFSPDLAADDKPSQKIKNWGEFVDPDGDCKIQEDKGKISIELPGTYHDLWPVEGKVNAPRILRDAEGDFSVQVKVAGAIRPEKGSVVPNLRSSVAFQAGSLLIWEDDNNFVRLDRACMVQGNKTISFCYYHAFKAGKRVVHLSQNFNDRDTHLRLERRKGKILAAFSQDGGTTWKSFRPEAVELAAKLKVGIAALNNTKKPFTVQFEDYKLTSEKGER
jgi:regulation of enolase protein 1 (concanavalin A-like superfamily)